MVIGRKKKAVVHIAKGDLHLDEESYRQILKGVAGVESATQLTEGGFEKVMRRDKRWDSKAFFPIPIIQYQRDASSPQIVRKGWNPSPRAKRISSLTSQRN